MTDLKSLVLFLSLQFFSQAQTAAAYRPYAYDLGFNPLPPTGISHANTATPVTHSSTNKWQYQGEYSWYLPKETSTGISGHPTSYSRPHATGTQVETKHDYSSLFPSHPRKTLAPYPSSSTFNVSEPPRATNSTSKVVILPTTGTGFSTPYPSISSQSSKVSAGVSSANSTKTWIEIVTLVPTPLSQTQRWVTRRSVKGSSQSATTSESQISSTTKGSKPTSPTTCPSGKFYTVVSGDTCEKIAREEKVPVGNLISQDQLPSSCNNLQIGQKLCLPQCKSYTVQPGDFCFKVAQKFNIELSDLFAANP